MANEIKLEPSRRKAILEARAMITDIITADANEADTCRRIERIFETLMGYDRFSHITKEFVVQGVGDADYCDFAIKFGTETGAKPAILVEAKRVNMELAPKHLKQVIAYAVNIGCEWAILTNGRQWQLHHVTFSQPPQTTPVESWDLMTDEIPLLSSQFEIIGLRNVKRDGLSQVWYKSNVLTPRNVLKVILSEASLNMIRRELKKEASIALTPEEIFGAIRRLLNETAVSELENFRISLGKKVRKTTSAQKEKPTQIPVSPPNDSDLSSTTDVK
ncbi:MAG: type I restriction enzyme HsdR N-terminal domain-containing protein [Dehalococcoidia bacterium]|nr:type I restriction enzyme HsdR N-terminal domain-containing protein [Dehalococcoidia bacterium]